MKLKPISLFFMAILSIFAISGTVYAQSSDGINTTDSEVIFLENGGHGMFKLSDEININSISSDSHLKAKHKHGDLYEIVETAKELPFNLVMKVKENKFLAVAEKEVTPANFHSILSDNRISDHIKEDLKGLMKEIEDRNLDTTVTIYSPDLIIDQPQNGVISLKGWEHSHNYYYTGYKNYSYKDEWYYISGYTSEPGSVKLTPYSYAQELYKKSFNHVISEGIGTVLSYTPMSWLSKSFYALFGPDNYIGGSTADRAIVSFSESKWRRYTSISWLGEWNFAAVMDYIDIHRTSVTKWRNVKSFTEEEEYRFRPSPSWDIQDQRAYQMRDSTMFWDEKIKSYNIYGLYFYAP